jgi:DNA mismatch repair protein MutS
MEKITPMFQQYLQIKAQCGDAILFYRMGDFYEMFFDDARIASRILDIALTSRDKDKDEGVPMCGVPHHAASSYIARLIEAGHKVAVCEQVEDPGAVKGLVRREIVRVVTPGLVLDGETLDASENNHLMGVCPRQGVWGVAVLDVSTGEFRATEVSGERTLLAEGERIRPREVIVPEGVREREDLARCLAAWRPVVVNDRPGSDFEPQRAGDLLARQFGLPSPDALGCGEMRAALGAAGAVLRYVRETQGERLSHLRSLTPYRMADHMVLDDWTRRNLELFENLQDRTRSGTLVSVLDRTLTPMGARMLRRWLAYPLVEPEAIQRRLDAVEELAGRADVLEALRGPLEGIQDVERLTGRASTGTAHGRDLAGLRASLRALPPLLAVLGDLHSPLLAQIRDGADPLQDVAGWLEETLVESPPLNLREGGLIREGVHPQLDEWTRIGREGKQYISRMEARERERTGIPTLRIGYNRVFGYYIEVTRSHAHAVPPEYVRKQTLVNAERYINEELKEYELKVMSAQERRTALEYELFTALRERVAGEARRVLDVAQRVAQVDVLASLARAAVENRYVRPTVDKGDAIEIRDGRHPVVERMPLQERFVPNDLAMDMTMARMIILTGPNMAGKSTFLRQVALIVLMAHAGSFVPAAQARVGIVDRIFTRVGAMDNLARGQSTFMVEMTETAQILHNATPRSLIVLDEVGRGTSTFDGLSIAWAVAEHILESPRIRAKTLFATHYHELTELALTREGVRNYHVAVREWNDQVIFLRRVVEGGTSRSYGIQVARLAGLPQEVIQRALEILANLETGELDEVGQPRLALSPRRPRGRTAGDPRQLNLFGGGGDAWLREALRALDLETLTPIEALNLLHRWKQEVR